MAIMTQENYGNYDTGKSSQLSDNGRHKTVKDRWRLQSPRAGHRNCPKNLRLSKPTDMTIHWKALEEYSLMVPLVFRFNHFWGENAFYDFFSLSKSSVLEHVEELTI
jgi:hypothetical protein